MEIEIAPTPSPEERAAILAALELERAENGESGRPPEDDSDPAE